MRHNGPNHPAKSGGPCVRSNKVGFSLVNRVSLIFKVRDPAKSHRSLNILQNSENDLGGGGNIPRNSAEMLKKRLIFLTKSPFCLKNTLKNFRLRRAKFRSFNIL